MLCHLDLSKLLQMQSTKNTGIGWIFPDEQLQKHLLARGAPSLSLQLCRPAGPCATGLSLYSSICPCPCPCPSVSWEPARSPQSQPHRKIRPKRRHTAGSRGAGALGRTFLAATMPTPAWQAPCRLRSRARRAPHPKKVSQEPTAQHLPLSNHSAFRSLLNLWTSCFNSWWLGDRDVAR